MNEEEKAKNKKKKEVNAMTKKNKGRTQERNYKIIEANEGEERKIG